MDFVLGVDLGTSAVKVLLVNRNGEVCDEVSKSYPLIQEQAGYSEQDPEQWVEKTIEAIKQITEKIDDATSIKGMSFSGQMHGLVLLDKDRNLLRHSILWNDTRTTTECREIEERVGKEKLHSLTKNPTLEGFTLPKILWVKKHEPETYEKADIFMLPKDYLRYRLTGKVHTEYSDAAGTLLLDVAKKVWSEEVCHKAELPVDLCPPLVASHEKVGQLLPEIAQRTGLREDVPVFAGGADNACGAIGAGILQDGKTLCSIGTSGVVLSYEKDDDRDYSGNVHYFNHGDESAFYIMGVTLAAGYSLSWFKETFAPNQDFESFVKGIEVSPVGAKGLLFTPYLVGERTPYADANIRSSFIGAHDGHQLNDFCRAIIEGITFSLNESIEILRESGKEIQSIVSIGGGAKSKEWLQIQADIFNAKVIKLTSEQGPGLGAAMLAAFGIGWFSSLQECANQFVKVKEEYHPEPERVVTYQELFQLYRKVYGQTRELNEALAKFR
ncbi:xylulokinase [Desertibacillus haloalkaliphilus]|uniref:xylulokinase n=1 Tax=Desertibacillus haloalkaliphilus TaxID=1328930 RepID=UPI001C26C410|nr:xylulokinase [Desertibacillus haloalkaliphilus]MBU8907690.1 xylulokinase [Desertibacillus haloalkaliphilus]